MHDVNDSLNLPEHDGDEIFKIQNYNDNEFWVITRVDKSKAEENKVSNDKEKDENECGCDCGCQDEGEIIFSGPPTPEALMETFAHYFDFDTEYEDKEGPPHQEIMNSESEQLEVEQEGAEDGKDGKEKTGCAACEGEEQESEEGNTLKVFVERPEPAEDDGEDYPDDD